MKRKPAPILDFCTREELVADPERVLQAAEQAPVVINASNGRFILRFEEGVKRSIKEWALSPGELEDDDLL
jgi:hypothetical protein